MSQPALHDHREPLSAPLQAEQAATARLHLPRLGIMASVGVLILGIVLVIIALAGSVWQWRLGAALRSDPMYGKSDAEIWAEAFAAADLHNFDQAREFAAKADNQTLAPALAWQEFRSGRSTASLQEISAFIDQHPDFPGVELAEISRQSILKQTKSPQEMLDYYQDHPPVNFPAQLHRLHMLAQVGRESEAIETARTYWRGRTLRPNDQNSLLDSFGRHFEDDDHLARLKHLMTNGARNSGRRLVQHLPEDWKPLATAWTENQSIDTVSPEFKNHPVFAVPIAIAADQSGDLTTAIAAIESIPDSQRLPKFEWRARHIVVRELIKTQRFDDAYRIALNHGLEAKAGDTDDMVAEANWLSGWIALSRMGLTLSAQQSFEAAFNAADSANWTAQSAYWLGLTHEIQRQTDRSQEMFRLCSNLPHTYYGQLCIAKIGESLFGDTLPIADPVPPADTFAAGTHQVMMDTVPELIKLGREADATKFIYRLGGFAKSTADLAILRKMALDAGLNRTALGMSWIAADRQVFELEGMLPTLDTNLLAPVALELALLHAIISRESVFVVDAVSAKGALGLMQVMPATGERLAKELGLEWSAARMTTDAGYNMTIGAAFLDSMVQRFDGNILLAIASYNAGPGNVDKWIKEFGNPSSPSIDAGIWVESIPFRETRNYVKDVVARYNLYRAVIARQPVNVFTSDYLSRI